ncbi:MAG: hypothetical protein RUMPE_00870 [Eubacteriales bacterium SKADARSKE-1]|nr:hypothetical protein [Eubacteriales bacterium SKADARSKE-1]
MMDKYIINTIEEYGRSVEIISPEMTKKITKAFIQPLRYKNNSYVGGKYIDLGKVDETNFLYIGKNDIRLDLYPLNTIIKTDEESYVVTRAQKVCIKEDIAYIWAILKLYVEEGY